MKRFFSVALIGLLACGCGGPDTGSAASESTRTAARSPAVHDQGISSETTDKIALYRRFADLHTGLASSTMSPVIEPVILPAGAVAFASAPVPVVRVAFPERAFFDSGSATPRPDSAQIFDFLAENMLRDVPEAVVTVLGHTDSVGTDAYNMDLSRRRAASVIAELKARGVRDDRLSMIAIGMRQPIAPNDTDRGRAENRRVEFLVSAAASANFAAVQRRIVSTEYLSLNQPDAVHLIQPAPVAGGQQTAVAEAVATRPADIVRRSAIAPIQIVVPRSATQLQEPSVQSARTIPDLPNQAAVSETAPQTVATSPASPDRPAVSDAGMPRAGEPMAAAGAEGSPPGKAPPSNHPTGPAVRDGDSRAVAAMAPETPTMVVLARPNQPHLHALGDPTPY